jgi:putative transcriptional regulator
MNEELFSQLTESIREAGAIRRKEIQPGRVTHIEAPDIKGIRKQHNLTQAQFAAMIGVSLRTLQEWEQGRRTPEGPAMVLLRVVSKFPEVVMQAIGVTI